MISLLVLAWQRECESVRGPNKYCTSVLVTVYDPPKFQSCTFSLEREESHGIQTSSPQSFTLYRDYDKSSALTLSKNEKLGLVTGGPVGVC
jgi:hypothetical protein